LLKPSADHIEKELLKGLSAGDKKAFAGIYHQYWELLLGMAYNRLKDLQAAEDIVHDVLAGIWINRHKQEIQSLRNYLATAVKYRILKEVRKSVMARNYQKGLIGIYITESDTDAAMDNKCMLQLLRKEVAVLPEKCRLIFRYSRDQGLTVREIAEKMQISPKTVENQLHKALHRLRLTIRNLPFFLLIVLFFFDRFRF
jgi:RNA polymerase sigma-70 factor (ECF subfamily)